MFSDYLASRVKLLLDTYHTHDDNERREFREAVRAVTNDLTPLLSRHDKDYCLSKARSFREHIPYNVTLPYKRGYTLGTMIFELEVYKRFDLSADADIYLKKIYKVIAPRELGNDDRAMSGPVDQLKAELETLYDAYAGLSQNQQKAFRDRSLDPLKNIDSLLNEHHSDELFEIAKGLRKNIARRQSEAFREGYRLGIIAFELNVYSRHLHDEIAGKILGEIPVMLDKLNAPPSQPESTYQQHADSSVDERVDQLSRFIEVFVMPLFLDLGNKAQEKFRKDISFVLTEFNQLPNGIAPNQRLQLALDKQKTYLDMTDIDGPQNEVYVSNMAKILGAMLAELLVYETWGKNEYARKKIEATKNRLWT